MSYDTAISASFVPGPLGASEPDPISIAPTPPDDPQPKKPEPEQDDAADER